MTPTETSQIPTAAELDQQLADISHVEHEIAVITTQYQAMLRPLENKLKELRYHFEPAAEAFARANAANGTKTHNLWHGTLRIRKQAQRLAITDEGYAFAFAERVRNDSLFKRPELNKASYIEMAKNFLEEFGELPDGVELIPERESFSYKTATPRASDILEESE